MLVTIDDSCRNPGRIRDLMRDILIRVATECDVPDRLKERFVRRLPAVTISCADLGDVHGRTRGQDITLNRTSINERVLFHELIHAMGGRELDAEVYERHCAPTETDPTRDDWPKFFRDSEAWGRLRAGPLVIWDPCTGDVWINDGTPERPRRGRPLRRLPGTPDWVLERYDVDCSRDSEIPENPAPENAEKK